MVARRLKIERNFIRNNEKWERRIIEKERLSGLLKIHFLEFDSRPWSLLGLHSYESFWQMILED